jgi:hypothetical protein
MNILRRVYERLVDAVTGTELMEVELPQEAREILDKLAELSGLKPSTVMRVIAAEHLMKMGVLDESVAAGS